MTVLTANSGTRSHFRFQGPPTDGILLKLFQQANVGILVISQRSFVPGGATRMRKELGTHAAPHWTKIFDEYPREGSVPDSFSGEAVRVRWGAELKAVYLPSERASSQNFSPDPTRDKELDNAEALTQLNGTLKKLVGVTKTGNPCTFERVTFRLAAVDGSPQVDEEDVGRIISFPFDGPAPTGLLSAPTTKTK